jgi:hypothetical protein
MTAFKARADRRPEECRFDDPAVARAACLPPHVVPVHVIGGDYEYDGTLRGVAVKVSGAVRYVVEDDNRRLFIHNARQIGVEEGWLPS